ncbi:hypothetical protein CTZ27_22555 [Streptomyces griseocarneus]|nr:hypothetical protein CTZ27_22555 [Streptomyces griseocarneus]
MQEQGPRQADSDVQLAAGLLRLAHTALDEATAAPTRSPAGGGKGMAALDRALGELQGMVEELAPTRPTVGVTAAAGIRTVITGMYVAEDVGRMAVLARQVGDIAWARRSKPPLAASVADPLRDIGEAALRLIDQAHASVLSPVAGPIPDASSADIEDRQSRLVRALLSVSGLDVMDAVDAAVLSRCYAECARRAASVAAHVALLRETTPQD